MTASLARSDGCTVTPTRNHLRAPLTSGAMACVKGRMTTIRRASEPSMRWGAKRCQYSVGTRAQANIASIPITTPVAWRPT